MTYGRCVTCGAPGVIRERRPDGDTTCQKGHKHKSASFDRHEQSFIHNNELGITPAGSYPPYLNLRPRGTGQGFTLTVRGEPEESNGIPVGSGSTVFIYLTHQDLADLRDHANKLLPAG